MESEVSMKKFLTIALLALISVNLEAKRETVKITRSMDNLVQGTHYNILVKKALGVNTFDDDKKYYQFYAKLYKANKNGTKGEVKAKGLCTNGIWQLRAPSAGLYIVELTYNKKLSKKVSDYLSKKHHKKILSAPTAIQNFKVKIIE